MRIMGLFTFLMREEISDSVTMAIDHKLLLGLAFIFIPWFFVCHKSSFCNLQNLEDVESRRSRGDVIQRQDITDDGFIIVEVRGQCWVRACNLIAPVEQTVIVIAFGCVSLSDMGQHLLK